MESYCLKKGVAGLWEGKGPDEDDNSNILTLCQLVVLNKINIMKLFPIWVLLQNGIVVMLSK